MDSVGAEVGQKMRSAIKAKLLELNCYVDDELPDYIMVMVANRRSKVQMNEDLGLFLSTKTAAFVDWLHIVLKKLKEVTVTNPEVYKRVTKRKLPDQEDIKVKKEKKSKKNDNMKKEVDGSLTDDLPIIAHRLAENQAIIFEEDIRKEVNNINEFDIPLLSEVKSSNEKDLIEIERKIKNVKSRLGLLVESDLEEENTKLGLDSFIASNPLHVYNSEIIDEQHSKDADSHLNDKVIDTFEESDAARDDEVSFTPEKPRKHSPITFEHDDDDDEYTNPKDKFASTKKISILKRLGKRVSRKSESSFEEKRISDYKRKAERFTRYSSGNRFSDRDINEDRHRKVHKSDRTRLDEKKDTDILKKSIKDYVESPKRKSSNMQSMVSQVGVMSKIYVPEKMPEESDIEDELKTREVRSVVQVKPRVVSSSIPQPNKNLLLKAVAEAHKSVSQATTVEPRLSKNINGEIPITRKLSHREKVKLRNIILAQVSREDSDSNEEIKEYEYVPKPLKKRDRAELPKYVPSSRYSTDEIELEEILKPRISVKSRLEGRKSPSPIIFEKLNSKVSNKVETTEKFSTTHLPVSVKNKERCKYWPQCRQGDKCEFVHPVFKCKMLPNCPYGGDKCLYIHPTCKFGSGCTKRECPFSHFGKTASAAKSPVTQPQTCKFFPKCTNSTCPFYHPKLCRFGKYCKNKVDCPFSHITVNKSNLTWRSNV